MNAPKKDFLRKSAQLKKKKTIGRGVIFFLALFFVWGGITSLFYLETFTIDDILVQGSKVVAAEEISAVAQEALQGYYFFIYPRRSMMAYPQEEISARLQAAFPRLAVVEVGVKNWQTLLIRVEERRTAILFCTPEREEPSCFFADRAGYVFAPAPDFSGIIFPQINLSLPADPLGTSLLSLADMEFLLTIYKNLDQLFERLEYKNFSVTTIEPRGGRDYVLQINDSQARNHWKLLVQVADAQEVLDDFGTVLASSEFRAAYQKAARLDYMDLRYHHKIFYRFLD